MDDEVIPGMNKVPEEMAQEIRFAAVVKCYGPGMLSQGKADEMSGYNPGEIYYSFVSGRNFLSSRDLL